MNILDLRILTFLNGFARHSRALDFIVSGISSNYVTKGGLIIALIWWAWFKGEKKAANREHIVFGLFAGVAAVAVARGLADLLPFRERPLRNPILNFQIPYGTHPQDLIHWSSFPSDHAALFSALAASLLFVSPDAGALALGYCLVMICLPRIYLGIHYPTDILGGVFIGVSIALLAKVTVLRRAVARPALALMETRPGAFYACLFLFTFQIATTFDSVRYIVANLAKLI